MALCRLLETPGIRASDVAWILGVSASQVTRWSRGDRRPSLDAAVLLEDRWAIPIRAWTVEAEAAAEPRMVSQCQVATPDKKTESHERRAAPAA